MWRIKMAKFDTHWGGRRGPNGPYEVDYEVFARQARDALGADGIVAVPNARGPGNKIGAEYRFEELLEMAEASGNLIGRLGDGRVFYDSNKELYFVKAQELNTTFDGEKLTFITYGLPIGFNLNDSEHIRGTLDLTKHESYPVALTAPSCINGFKKLISNHLDKSNNDVLDCFDAIITHASSATIGGLPFLGKKMFGIRRPNRESKELYDLSIYGSEFGAEKHRIGQLFASKGHRTPKSFWSPSIGSSYSEIEMAQEYSSAENFLTDLKEGMRNSQEGKKGSANLESGIHLACMLKDKLLGHR